MDSINLKHFLMGAGGWVTPPRSNILARLTFVDNSQSDVVDSNANYIVTLDEGVASIPIDQSYSTVTQVTITSSCDVIDEYTFANYSGYDYNPVSGVNLVNASLLSAIGHTAFGFWTSANISTDLVIPSNVVNIYPRAFIGWTSMTKGLNLTSATSLLSINSEAFFDWRLLDMPTDLVIPSNVAHIGYASFYNWTSMTEGLNLTSATSLSAIGVQAFGFWSSANMSTDLVIPSNVTAIGQAAFGNWASMTGGLNLTSATSLSAIGVQAFSFWSSVNMSTDLVIPSNVTVIGDSSFRHWTSMTNGVTFNNITPPTIGNNAFGNWNSSIPVTVQPLIGDVTPSTYSAWKVALGSAGTFASINGIPWASIP